MSRGNQPRDVNAPHTSEHVRWIAQVRTCRHPCSRVAAIVAWAWRRLWHLTWINGRRRCGRDLPNALSWLFGHEETMNLREQPGDCARSAVSRIPTPEIRNARREGLAHSHDPGQARPKGLRVTCAEMMRHGEGTAARNRGRRAAARPTWMLHDVRMLGMAPRTAQRQTA
jgi:hypothetical protein